jgi:hypothetical protein
MTCAHNACGTCKFLRIEVLKRFLFPQVSWNWEGKCLSADGWGAAKSLLDWAWTSAGDLIHHGVGRELFCFQIPPRCAHRFCLNGIGEQAKNGWRKGARIFRGNEEPSDSILTASGFPPISVTMTGRDDAMALMMALEKTSLRERRTKNVGCCEMVAQIPDCAIETDMMGRKP